MEKTIVVVDDAAPDDCAARAARVLSRFGDVETLVLSEFLRQAGISYDYGSGLLIRDAAIFNEFAARAADMRLLNRVVEISHDACHALLDPEQPRVLDTLPARFVLSAYVGLFSAFKHVWGQPGRYSSVGNLLPLDLQWYEMSTRRRDIGVPRYVYSQFVAGPIDFERPIWTTAYDLYDWKVNATPEVANLHPFVVERPTGDPAMVYFVGEASRAFSLGDERHLTDDERARLDAIVPTLKDAFGAVMGESLVFIDGEHVVFAAFSHHLRTSMQRKRFESVLERGIADWLGEEVGTLAYS